MAQKSMIESVKEEIVSAIKGTGDIVNAVVDTVTGTLTNTIKGTGAVATSLIGALSDTARASIQEWLRGRRRYWGSCQRSHHRSVAGH